jgi:hypothetical protein
MISLVWNTDVNQSDRTHYHLYCACILYTLQRLLTCAEYMVRTGAYCCRVTCWVSESGWMHICVTQFEFI